MLRTGFIKQVTLKLRPDRCQCGGRSYSRWVAVPKSESIVCKGSIKLSFKLLDFGFMSCIRFAINLRITMTSASCYFTKKMTNCICVVNVIFLTPTFPMSPFQSKESEWYFVFQKPHLCYIHCKLF